MRTFILTPLLACFINFVYCQVSLPAYALSDLSVIDALHRKPLDHQTIVIRHGVIEQIFPDGSQSLPDSVVVIILKGKYVIPGLIDSHVHLATDPSGVDNRPATLSVLSRMLFSGVTSVRDMAGDARVLAGLSRDAGTGDIVAPTIYFSALMAGPTFFNDPRTASSTIGGVPGEMPYMKAINDAVDLPLVVAAAKGTGATGIKLYAHLSAKEVRNIVIEAHKQGMYVWAHAWLLPARPSDLILAGVRSISHSPLMAGEMLYRKSFDSIPDTWKKAGLSDRFWKDYVAVKMDSLFSLMKRHHTILDATMSTYRLWAEENPAMKWEYELTKRITAAAYRAGVDICTGTDDDQTKFVQYEIRTLVSDAGFLPIDALIAATLHGAEALGIDHAVGTIEASKKADLVVLDKNPLDNLDNLDKVYMVIKGGMMYNKPDKK